MVWDAHTQNMRPRRAHTKSRNGCDQCKKRRVKVTTDLSYILAMTYVSFGLSDLSSAMSEAHHAPIVRPGTWNAPT